MYCPKYLHGTVDYLGGTIQFIDDIHRILCSLAHLICNRNDIVHHLALCCFLFCQAANRIAVDWYATDTVR